MSRRTRLETPLLHQIICQALEQALNKKSSIVKDKDGFVDAKDLLRFILAEQEKYADKNNHDKFEEEYNVSELINKGITPWLKVLGKRIERRKVGKAFVYKGYAGLEQDYLNSRTMNSNLPIEEDIFEFIKGTVSFSTLSAIRNRIKAIDKKESPKEKEGRKKKGVLMEKLIKNGPFLCFEESVYEFTPQYKEKTKQEQKLLLTFADAIVVQTALKVLYKPLHYKKTDELEFHPHYIRQVGKKLIVYGFSKSMKRKSEYKLSNLIFQRIINVETLDEPVEYRSAAQFGIDYNRDFFLNTMTYNANIIGADRNKPTEVILKVCKERIGMPSGRIIRPFDRILSEPLHHSQEVYRNIPTDKKYGYIRLFVSDYLYIKPILLAWGSSIEVLKPEDLRLKMIEEIKEMMMAYRLGFQPESEGVLPPSNQNIVP